MVSLESGISGILDVNNREKITVKFSRTLEQTPNDKATAGFHSNFIAHENNLQAQENRTQLTIRKLARKALEK